MSVEVEVRRGGLYLSSFDCDQFFGGLESVILLRRDNDFMVLPVRHAAAGGYLLKRRNAAGDRLVFAPDFFQEQGLAHETSRRFHMAWDTSQMALVAKNAFV